MNIIYFLDFPFFLGGASKVLMTQAFIMKQRGCSVKIVIPNDEEGQHLAEYDEICRSYELETTEACYHISTCMEEIDIVESIRECDAIADIIESFRPDIIHSTQLNLAVELAARKLKIPHLMNIYQVDKHVFQLKWIKAYPQYHSADSLLFSECWGKGLGISSRCIRVAYKIAESREDEIQKKRTRPVQIVSIGALCERKNQLEIIKFVLKCKKNNHCVKLVLLGNDKTEYGAKCRQFVEENALWEEVDFKGFVLNIEDYLKGADVLIHAATVESYPGVIVESMANKVPVITTAVAGVPELLCDKKNAFFTDSYRSEDIYKTFLEFVQYRDSGRISHITDNAFATYLQQHTYEAVGEDLEDYYRWIIKDYCHNNEVQPGKDELKREFEAFVRERQIKTDSVPTMRFLWFLRHLFTAIEEKENKKLVIWGAGFWGAIALEWIQLLGGQIEFKGFIDTSKHGEYLGHPIVENRDVVIAECGIILVAIADKKNVSEVMSYLEKSGKERNVDYFRICNLGELPDL